MNLDRRPFLGAAACLAALVAAAWRPLRPARADEAAPRVFEITVHGGKIADGETTIRVKEGDMVEIRWTSDEPVEFHLHGYDIEVTAGPGKTGIMAFEAFAMGRFPVEAHSHGGDASHVPVLYLEVHPR